MNDDGATLIEAIGFILIAVLMVLSAVAIYQLAFQSSTSQTIIREFHGMQEKIHGLFSNQESYKAITPLQAEPLLIDAEAVVESLLIAPGASAPNKVRNKFGGHVDFLRAPGLGTGVSASAPEGNGPNNQRFKILYTDLPEATCIDITTSIGPPFNQVMILNADGSSIRYSTDEIDNAIGITNQAGLPVQASIAQEACVEGGIVAYYSR